MSTPLIPVAAIPYLFVLLWSTGFIGAKYTLPFAEPMTLLGVRMWLTTLILGVLFYRRILSTLRPVDALHAVVAGILIHVLYLGSVFTAIGLGMSAGLAALLVGLQPILTAVLSFLLYRETLALRQIIGLIAGLVGVAMVVSMNIGPNPAGFPGIAYVFALIGLVGITVGTLYQKKNCGGFDLPASLFYQYLGAAVVFTVLAFGFETREIIWSTQFILGLLWLVLVLSIFSVWLLMILIDHGHATRVASYFYMVPASTALMAWVLFNEQLTPLAIAGMLLTALGVYLVVKSNTPTKI